MRENAAGSKVHFEDMTMIRTLAAVAYAVLCATSVTARDKEISLFDGKTLTGWEAKSTPCRAPLATGK
jgi:hypothetical protein